MDGTHLQNSPQARDVAPESAAPPRTVAAIKLLSLSF
jgi:hypothetical protein